MSYANILVKEISPISGNMAIPLDTIFQFKLVPYNGSTINIETLEIEVKIQSSAQGTITYNFTHDSPEATYVGIGDTYSISVDVDAENSINFNSNDVITISIDIEDVLNASMRTFYLSYKTIDMNQISAFQDLTRHFTDIIINQEEGRLNYAGTVATFTWQNWLTTVEPEVFINDLLSDGSGYTVDYTNGKITFASALSTGRNKVDSNDATLYEPIDRVNTNYRYSCFTIGQMVSFMDMALKEFNANYPMSNYSITSTHTAAKAAMILGGSYYLYNNILSGFINQQFRVQWGEEEWKDLIDVARTMKENTKEVFKNIIESKKHVLANPQGIIVPEYTLPGGRSRFFSFVFGSY